MEDQMERILELMAARASGKVTNEAVETAVASILQKSTVTATRDQPPKETDSSTKHINKANESKIELDEGNYDQESDEATMEQTKPTKRGRKRKNITHKKSLNFEPYMEIPLGKQGAQMMVTFGDGPAPKPKVVEKVLLGARRMLQVCIQDARHVRRDQRKIYQAAKSSLKADRPTKPNLKEEWSHEVMFRAMEGYDPLSYETKCGFGIEELQQLYPEEMNAYNKWIHMHAQAQLKNEAEEAVEVDSTVEPDEEKDSNDPDAIGHLHERAAQFDLRTDRMQDEWYLEFSEVRQGSFLPRRKPSMEAEWSKKQGAGWGNISAVTVRFLHWLGFNPQSELPPPSEDIADGLAYLGYDFFGRIVEKAIFLRNLERQKVSGEIDEANVLLELSEGEQLEEIDIDRAMNDPEIKPVPLFHSNSNAKTMPQLYFGPGFESRLEMEMEELASTRLMSEEEEILRKHEDQLFAALSATKPSDFAILMDEWDGDDNNNTKSANK